MNISHQQHVEQIDTAALTPRVQASNGYVHWRSRIGLLKGMDGGGGENALGIYRFSGVGHNVNRIHRLVTHS